MAIVEVIIVPIGSFPISEAALVTDVLGERFPEGVRFRLLPSRLHVPLTLFDWSRAQYRAGEVALHLAGSLGILDPPRILALGLSEADAFVEGLNFVFGVALPTAGAAVVFSRRLYARDRNLYLERLIKESMHEVGHLLGLDHCPNPRCVMSFSNSIHDVDRKEAAFCEACLTKLEDYISRLGRSLGSR
ncbi:MAG: archaemetzincin family Zn-dependent metalloprotease [Desulfurococcales archaeon]|nr:archaemetzincin family Zn-dependent metalloprotease [Desulfurococcales archaeon]